LREQRQHESGCRDLDPEYYAERRPDGGVREGVRSGSGRCFSGLLASAKEEASLRKRTLSASWLHRGLGKGGKDKSLSRPGAAALSWMAWLSGGRAKMGVTTNFRY
jgi:hypothetical protein